MKKMRRVLGMLTAVILCITSIPVPAAADSSVPIGEVYVSIEDTVPTPAGETYPDPRGVMAEGWVDLYQTDSTMDVIVRLAEANGMEVVGAESNYISSIGGLAAFDRGSGSGWMGTINDWFTNAGFGDFTVESGGLGDGDTVSILYTLNYGEDVGSSWSNNNKTLSALECSEGELEPAFSGDVKEYTLTVPEGTKSVTVTPTAVNKNFQVRSSVDGTEYKRTQDIPVENGTVITVKCGDPAWPSMNNQAGGDGAQTPAEVYSITVQTGEVNHPPKLQEGVAPKAEANLDLGQAYTAELSTIFTDEDQDELNYKVSINGNAPVEAEASYSYQPDKAGTSTLTFTANDGSVDSSQTYTVTLHIKDTSVTDADLLEQIESKLYNLRPTYGTDSNMVTMMEEKIKSMNIEGTENVQVSILSSSDSHVAADGAITYYNFDDYANAGFSSVYQVNVDVVYHLVLNDTEKDITNRALIGWDGQAVKDKLEQEELPKVTEDSIKGENVNLQEVTSDLDLPQILGGSYRNSLTQITWTSSNPEIIEIVKNGYDWDYNNYTGKVTIPSSDTQVTLTAAFTFTKTNSTYEEDIILTKEFQVAVKKTGGDEEEQRAQMQQKLDTSYTAEQLKDFITKEPLDCDAVTGDMKLPVPSQIGFDSNKEIKVTSSNTDVMTINGYRTYVYQPLPGSPASEVNLVITYTKDGISVYKEIPLKIQPLSQEDIDSEITLMEKAKASYFEGINDGRNLSKDKVTESLHGFREVRWNEDQTALQWSYHINDDMGKGIQPVDINPDDQMGTSGYRTFKSSNTSVITHENLLVTRPENNTSVTISSVLSSIKYEKYAEKYPESEDLQKLYRQPVSVDVTVKGTKMTPASVSDGSAKRISSTEAEISFTSDTEGTYYYQVTEEGSPAPEIDTSGDGTAAVEGVNSFTVKELAEGAAELFLTVKNEAGISEVLKVRIPDYVDLTAKLIKDPKLSTGIFWTPLFERRMNDNKGARFAYVHLPLGTDTFEFTFRVSEEDVEVYDSEGNKMVPDSEGIYKMSIDVTSAADGDIYLPQWLMGLGGQSVNFQMKAGDQTASYRLNVVRKNLRTDLEVVDYFCIGSQYTNMGNYGLFPERSLMGGASWNTPISLGGFGGYITYKFANPVKNDPANPYGIDFIVYGNSNGGGGFSEPGNVMVSEDGENWFMLAGSDYFDDNTVWNYQLTYSKGESNGKNNRIDWTDMYGNTGTMSLGMHPPKNEYYPNAEFDSDQPVTVTGALLKSDAKDDYGTAAAAFPDFGYADVHTNSKSVGGTGEDVTVTGEAGNPYGTDREGYGDGFDLDWAVDAEGNPVYLDSIQYVKIQTASHVDGGAIGEKSTEVNSIVTAAQEDKEVGKTNAPASITVNGEALAMQEGVNSYKVKVEEQKVTVAVDAPVDANVYINNQRGTSRTFESMPREGIIRVIVQEAEKEPVIYYINSLKPEELVSEVALNHTNLSLGKGGSTRLKAVITPDTALDKVVSWSSSNPAVASVDQTGMVTSGKEGTAVISVTSNDGGKTAECKVTVDFGGTWKKDGKGWWYGYNDGSWLSNCRMKIGRGYYAFDGAGYMKTGWVSLGGRWSYHTTEGSALIGWQKIDGVWYYLKNDSLMSTGWLKQGNTWYYLNGSGRMLTGWYKVGNTWYYSNGSGAMLTGWQKIGGTWYYLRESGAMATGWIQLSGKWYYLNGSGAMQTGWYKVGSTWYYSNGSGAMLTGWQKIGGTWYYLRESGAMAIGWLQLSGKWYYLQKSGKMASDSWVGRYYVNKSGVWTKTR